MKYIMKIPRNNINQKQVRLDIKKTIILTEKQTSNIKGETNHMAKNEN